MKFSAKKFVLSGVVAGAVVALGGGVAVAANQEPTSPAPPVPHAAEPAHEGVGKGNYTAGDYRLFVHELTDEGTGMGTMIMPGDTYTSEILHTEDPFQPKPTVLKFSVGDDFDGPIVYTYPVPQEKWQNVDCVASGTEAEPTVECTTTPAG